MFVGEHFIELVPQVLLPTDPYQWAEQSPFTPRIDEPVTDQRLQHIPPQTRQPAGSPLPRSMQLHWTSRGTTARLNEPATSCG